MQTQKKDGKVLDQSDQTRAVDKTILKKRYVSPELVEYGSIAKLTQGTRTRKNDGSNTKRRKCL